MRRLLSPRWLAVHVIVFALAALFVRLGLWQLHRSESPTGGVQNLIYALQWPTFALFGLFLWAKTIREELHPKPQATDPEPGAQANDGATSRAMVRAPEEPDDELAAYNRYLAALHHRDQEAHRR